MLLSLTFFRFYECESVEKFFNDNKCRLALSDNVELSSNIRECYICFQVEPVVGLSCGHLFCRECWNSYLLTRIKEEKEPFPSCIDPECKLIVDADSVLELLINEKEKTFYKKFVTNCIVNTNPLLKACPGIDCDNVVKCVNSGFQTLECKCGTTFCFSCSYEGHLPVPCNILKKWLKKVEGDSLTMKWIDVNTKDCPKCSVPIEKNGGCMRMVCRNNQCMFEFCWLCMKSWSVHGYQGVENCGRFRPADDGSEKAESRKFLERYMHYYDRYMNHQKSLKAEEKLMTLINTKISLMQEQKCFSWIETQFLNSALDSLQRCRRSLMYSYAFCFYLSSNNAKVIFEDNQQDLEHATEELSGLLEQEMDLEKDDFSELKRKVQDRYHYVDQRREIMLQHCQEGMDNQEWIFVTVD